MKFRPFFQELLVVCMQAIGLVQMTPVPVRVESRFDRAARQAGLRD
jgi:hypothetical protein